MAGENILVTPATVWYAPKGESLPDETSVAYGASWGGNWSYLGDTLEPLTMGAEINELEVEIQQATAAVKKAIISEKLRLTTVLAEHTPETLGLVFGGTLSTVAAGAGQKAYKKLVFGGRTALPEYAWGFEGVLVDATNTEQPVRYLFYRGSLSLNGDMTFDKGAPSGVPISISLLADTTKSQGEQLGELVQVTAAATS